MPDFPRVDLPAAGGPPLLESRHPGGPRPHLEGPLQPGARGQRPPGGWPARTGRVFRRARRAWDPHHAGRAGNAGRRRRLRARPLLPWPIPGSAAPHSWRRWGRSSLRSPLWPPRRIRRQSSRQFWFLNSWSLRATAWRASQYAGRRNSPSRQQRRDDARTWRNGTWRRTWWNGIATNGTWTRWSPSSRGAWWSASWPASKS